MAHTQPVKGKPWFTTPGKPGDRTLEQQLMGLEPLFAEVAGKTVLDVGCAEGLISLELLTAGALHVCGVEVRPTAVALANVTRRNQQGDASLPREGSATFEVGDANTYRPGRTYDIVLLLAILHKLKEPSAACRRLAAAAKDLVVIRLPPANAPTVIDTRSGCVPYLIGVGMQDDGFRLERNGYTGPFGEWMGYYRRVK